METPNGQTVLVEQIIANIIRQEMCLETDAVWVRDTNKVIKIDNGIYVSVGIADSKPIASTNIFDSDTLEEIQQAVICENIQIDIFSRSSELMPRRWEIMGALSSFFSKQQQELYSFKIFKLPRSFVNTSGTEGGSTIVRYTTIFSCHVWYRKEKVLQSDSGDYFDDFTQRVDDSVSIDEPHGIIEFTIS